MQTPPPAGNYSLVPLENAVIVAEGMLGLTEESGYRIRMMDLAQKATLNMNPLSLIYIDNIELDVINGVATLPDGIIMPLAMRYCSVDGVAVGPYIADIYWLETCGCSVSGERQWDPGMVTLVGNEYRWVEPTKAPDKVKVAVTKRQISTDGTFTNMIKDYMEMAVASYVCWQMGLMLMATRAYTQYQIEEWKKMWIGERGAVVSGDAQRLFYERRQSFNRMQKPLRIEIF